MSARVNLLLLLSALLSALSGVGASARQPQVAQAVAQQARVAAPRAVTAPALRPALVLPSLAAAALAPVARGWALAAIEPAFAIRRRE